METESKQPQIEKKKSRKLTVICCVIAFLLIAAGSIFAYLAVQAQTDKIYDGIKIGSVNVGECDESQALKKIARTYDIDEMTAKFQCEDLKFEIYTSQVSFKIDYNATVTKAVQYGKNQNIFRKIQTMLSLKKHPKTIDLIADCNHDLLQYALNEKLGSKITEVNQYYVEIGEDFLTVCNGKSGSTVKSDTVARLMARAVTKNTIADPIVIKPEQILPDPIDIKSFYAAYNRPAADATCTQDGEAFNITPEVIGIQMDKKIVTKIIEQNRKSFEPYTIPAQITYPQVTAKALEAEFTNTVLGSFSSNYGGSSANRKANIALASSKINGFILNPGETFSYNAVVGPRTEAAGFKLAHVYSGNEVVDGIGGGICQVSSTMYNAVVLADLQIVKRTNHSLPVSYVPLGRDATVSYGTIDFVVKNDKATPMKFEVIANGSTLTFNVYGLEKYKKDISIETVITGTTSFATTEIKDETLFEGERITKSAGSNGSTVESYKVVKENGNVVSRTLLSKSTYSPVSAVVRVGVQKRASATVPAQAQPASPQDISGQAELPPDTANTPQQ